MNIKDILLLVDLVREDSAATRVAIELAAQQDAHLTGLTIAIDPIFPSFMDAPVSVEAIAVARQAATEAAEAASTRFRTAAERAGVRYEARQADAIASGADAIVGTHALLADLVVVGQQDDNFSEPLREAFIETALFEAGAPTLVVPYVWRNGFSAKQVMIAWDGGRTAARAVRAALPILSLASEIRVVTVNGAVGGGEPGADVATWLARHGLEVTIGRVPSGDIGIGEALLNHAADSGADLLVMGAYGHSRIREFLIGGTTRTLLGSMTLPVLMAH